MKTITKAITPIGFLLTFILFHHSLKAGSIEKIPLSGPLGFIENKGQFRDQNGQPRSDLLYMYLRDGLKIQVLPSTISFELYTMEDNPASVSEADGYMRDHNLDPEDRPIPYVLYKSNRIDLQFIGANPNPEIVAADMFPDYLNYYLSFTPTNGITKVNHYNKITYKNLYPNIDLVLTACPEQYPSRAFAYDFVVHPGGNVNDIHYRYLGSDNQIIYDNGTLATSNATGQLFEMIPESYIQNEFGMKIMPVDVSFRKDNDAISFDVPDFDKKQSLVIDPVLIWATYAGGSLNEEGRGAAVDSGDNVILIGRTYSPDGIATVGAYQTVLDGDVDVQMEKYTANCVRLWGTYYGGSGNDHARGIITNDTGGIYLGCHTDSPDGCATPGAWKENLVVGGNGDDALLAFFSASGFRQIATYYGGDKTDIVRRLDFDVAGNIVVVGYSESDTGIVTPGAYQTDWHGNSDLMLSKWTPDLQLMWGSYLGGESEDHGRSVHVGHDDYIYVNGSTGSPHGIAKNAYRDHDSGGQDYLLAKFKGDGSTVKWSTYWGGTQEDRGRGVFVDDNDKWVYYTGYSASDTGVATPGAFQTTWSEGYDGSGQPFHDAVLLKWSTDGYPIWCTYIGGPLDDRGRAITMIGHDVYVGGTTSNNTVMSTPDGFQPVFGGNDDMFVEKFDSLGNRIWGSYIGEEGSESTLALAVDKAKTHIYQVGTTSSLDISTPGVAQPVYGGFEDCFLAKYSIVDTATGIPALQDTKATLRIYPNPSMGYFSAKYHIPENALLTIYDVKGNMIYSKEINAAAEELKVNGLDALPGIYTCSISLKGTEIAQQPFIILK